MFQVSFRFGLNCGKLFKMVNPSHNLDKMKYLNITNSPIICTTDYALAVEPNTPNKFLMTF